MLERGYSCTFSCLAGYRGHRALTTQPDREPNKPGFLTLAPSGRVTSVCLPHVPHLPQQCGPWPIPPLLTLCQDSWADTMCEWSPTTFQGPAQPLGWQPLHCCQSQGFCQKPSEKATFLHLVSGEVFCSIFSLDRSLARHGGCLTCWRTDCVSFLLSILHWLPTACRIKDTLFAPSTYKALCDLVSIYIFTSAVLPPLYPPCIL